MPGASAEIATHTISHVASPNATQIVGARDWLVNVRGGACCMAHARSQAIGRCHASAAAAANLPANQATPPAFCHRRPRASPRTRLAASAPPSSSSTPSSARSCRRTVRVWATPESKDADELTPCLSACPWLARRTLHGLAHHPSSCLPPSQPPVLPLPSLPQASGSTRPSLNSTPPRPRPPPASACGPIPWIMECPRTAPSGALLRSAGQGSGVHCWALARPLRRRCPLGTPSESTRGLPLWQIVES